MKRLVARVAFAFAIFPSLCWSCQTADSSDEATSASSIGDIIFSNDPQAVRIRLFVEVDGNNAADRFTDNQQHYVQALFNWLDHNDDNRLSQQETAKAPSPQMLLPSPVTWDESEELNFAFNFSVLDDNDDGWVSREELQMFYRDFGDGPLRIRYQRGNIVSPSVDHLFLRLDENRDDILTSGELLAFEALFRRDEDANEVISRSELGWSEMTPRMMVNGRPSGGTQTSPSPFKLSGANNGRPDVSLHLRIDSATSGRHRFELGTSEPGNENGAIAARLSQEGTLVVQVGEVRIELSITPERTGTFEQCQLALRREFSSVDSDRDGIIDRTDELPRYLQQSFDLMDRDGDQQLDHEELNGYVSRILPLEAAARGDRFTLHVSEPGVGLFDLLDRNRDGQLGLREFREANRRVFVDNADSVSRVALGQLPRSYYLSVTRGAMPSPYQSADVHDAGPIWFFRMDRNHDGDVSSREFFGGQELFTELDTDKDNLVSIDEVLEAENRDRP